VLVCCSSVVVEIGAAQGCYAASAAYLDAVLRLSRPHNPCGFCQRHRSHPVAELDSSSGVFAGLASAKSLLEPMLKDPADFVRQGANIAMALVMLQRPEAAIGDFRKHLEATYSDKHEDNVCKMGAIMACGILDAGALLSRVSLRTRHAP
jgi:hypothetical protein